MKSVVPASRNAKSGRRLIFRRTSGCPPPCSDIVHAAGASVKNTACAGDLVARAAPTFAAKWLVQQIATCNEQHPDIDVRIDAAKRVVEFACEDVDVAIRFRTGDEAGLAGWPLFNQPEEIFRSALPPLLQAHRRCALPAIWRRASSCSPIRNMVGAPGRIGQNGWPMQRHAMLTGSLDRVPQPGRWRYKPLGPVMGSHSAAEVSLQMISLGATSSNRSR